AILLCTYNGALFLESQLESFVRQTYTNIELWISDDGSTDETIKIIEGFRRRWGGRRLELLEGPRGGFVKNFMGIVCNYSIDADYYAFSDQDDIWMDDKLERAIQAIRQFTGPALYGSSTRLIDGSENVI